MPPRDPRPQLAAAGDEYKAARSVLDNARTAVQPLIVKALKAGIGVVEAAELSGYTRESIRLIARKNGIEPK